MHYITQRCVDVLNNNYLPYALSVIVSRALVEIDGLKPSQRKLLYTMYKMGLSNDKTKCANIVGQTMKLNPHGDMAIYDALVKMSSGNDAMLAPYIESKGSFGHVWSDDKVAAPRYTEAGLAKIAKELFDGVDENAVDMVDNYDGTMKEPLLLPTKFPNVLVNSTAGIAVGMASNIAKYSLKDVCEATIKVLKEEITDIDGLYEVLKCPDFTTGGIIHNTGNDFKNILNKKGSLTVTSRMTINRNRLEVVQIPYNTTTNKIMNQITELRREGKLQRISDYKDLTDLSGLNITIDFKRGTNVEDAIEELLELTDLRSTVSFENRLLIDGVPKLLSVLDIIHEWIEFRVKTIRRVCEYRLAKLEAKMDAINGLMKIKDHVREVAILHVENKEADVVVILQERFGLTENEAHAILNMRNRDMTKDNIEKKIAEMEGIIKERDEYKAKIEDRTLIELQIIKELEEISKKYGKDRITEIGQPLVKKKRVVRIDDSPVVVSVTENGYLKKTRTDASERAFLETLGGKDKVIYRMECKNNEDLLLFTYGGVCHKIPVNDLDETKGTPKDMIVKFIGKGVEVLYATNSGDYTKELVFVDKDCRGTILNLDRIKNNRSSYKSLYNAGVKDGLWCIEEKEFMLITDNKKAVYCNAGKVTRVGSNGKIPFRVCRKDAEGTVVGVKVMSKVSNINVPGVKEEIIEKYEKAYFTKLKHTL